MKFKSGYLSLICLLNEIIYQFFELVDGALIAFIRAIICAQDNRLMGTKGGIELVKIRIGAKVDLDWFRFSFSCRFAGRRVQTFFPSLSTWR